MYIYIYICIKHIYIYITLLVLVFVLLLFRACALYRACAPAASFTPSPPTKSFPTRSPRVELSGRLPIKLYGHENSHPLELRVCSSQTL